MSQYFENCKLNLNLAYLFNFSFKVIGVVAILHKQDNFLLVLAVVKELHDVFVLQRGLDHALLPSVSELHLINQFVFLDCFLYNGLFQGKLKIKRLRLFPGWWRGRLWWVTAVLCRFP
jgi:hypothetical protein